jgi:hypothetical protein
MSLSGLDAISSKQKISSISLLGEKGKSNIFLNKTNGGSENNLVYF